MMRKTKLWILFWAGLGGLCDLSATSAQHIHRSQSAHKQRAGIVKKSSKHAGAPVSQAPGVEGYAQPQVKKEPRGFWAWILQWFGGQTKDAQVQKKSQKSLKRKKNQVAKTQNRKKALKSQRARGRVRTRIASGAKRKATSQVVAGPRVASRARIKAVHQAAVQPAIAAVTMQTPQAMVQAAPVAPVSAAVTRDRVAARPALPAVISRVRSEIAQKGQAAQARLNAYEKAEKALRAAEIKLRAVKQHGQDARKRLEDGGCELDKWPYLLSAVKGPIDRQYQDDEDALKKKRDADLCSRPDDANEIHASYNASWSKLHQTYQAALAGAQRQNPPAVIRRSLQEADEVAQKAWEDAQSIVDTINAQRRAVYNKLYQYEEEACHTEDAQAVQYAENVAKILNMPEVQMCLSNVSDQELKFFAEVLNDPQDVAELVQQEPAQISAQTQVFIEYGKKMLLIEQAMNRMQQPGGNFGALVHLTQASQAAAWAVLQESGFVQKNGLKDFLDVGKTVICRIKEITEKLEQSDSVACAELIDEMHASVHTLETAFGTLSSEQKQALSCLQAAFADPAASGLLPEAVELVRAVNAGIVSDKDTRSVGGRNPTGRGARA